MPKHEHSPECYQVGRPQSAWHNPMHKVDTCVMCDAHRRDALGEQVVSLLPQAISLIDRLSHAAEYPGDGEDLSGLLYECDGVVDALQAAVDLANVKGA